MVCITTQTSKKFGTLFGSDMNYGFHFKVLHMCVTMHVGEELQEACGMASRVWIQAAGKKTGAVLIAVNTGSMLRQVWAPRLCNLSIGGALPLLEQTWTPLKL